MNSVRNEDKRLAGSALTGRCYAGMWCCFFPRICLAVDDCKTRVADVEGTVLVDDFDVGWFIDAERLAADDAQVLDVEGAGD